MVLARAGVQALYNLSCVTGQEKALVETGVASSLTIVALFKYVLFLDIDAQSCLCIHRSLVRI